MKHEGRPEALDQGISSETEHGQALIGTSDGMPMPVDAGLEGQRYALGGLSGKLLLLTLGFVMLAEILIYVPSVANFRNNWLNDRLATAGVAAAVLSETNTVAPRLQQELLRVTGAIAISLDFGTRRNLVAMSEMPPDVAFVADMAEMTPLKAILESFQTLFYQGEGTIRIVGKGQMGLVKSVDVVVPVRLLQSDMLAFSVRILGLSLVISIITASLVYISLRALFVRPLQRLTRAMSSFAEAPEDPAQIIAPSRRQDEIGAAQAGLSAMQEGLSRALHQKQRLADLGLAVSKINHDLRNLLASAQLFLERLESVPDPTVSRLAPKILATLDRAVTYTQAVMAYGKAQERVPQRRLLSLRQIAEDISDVLGLSEGGDIVFENKVPPDLEVNADPEQLFRVLLNLCRNSVQALENEKDTALVKRVTLEGRRSGTDTFILVSDTGPGIPEMARKGLFKAFHSSSKSDGVGLGLAIAAELLKAHGAQIWLDAKTVGTTFVIRLPDPAPVSEIVRRQGNGRLRPPTE